MLPCFFHLLTRSANPRVAGRSGEGYWSQLQTLEQQSPKGSAISGLPTPSPDDERSPPPNGRRRRSLATD